MRLPLLTAFMFIFAMPAQAQDVSGEVMAHAQNVAKSCLSKWDSAACVKAVGASNKDLAIGYAENLHAKGKKQAVEAVKNGCAAATVEDKKDFPARAFASAYTECVNTIYDTTVSTKVMPDQSHYQLLVASGLCMSGDQRCAAFEAQMKAWAR